MIPVISFGRVDWHAEKVLIVATGPSSQGLVLRKHDLPGVYIIAIKQAILSIEAHAWVTVDPNDRARGMMQNQVSGVKYIAAVPDDYGSARPRIAAHRGPPEPNVLYLRRVMGSGPLKSKEELSEDTGSIHTGNSAYGGLGVAYHMRPRKIGFIGLDGTQQGHGIGSGSPRGSLAHLPNLFRSAIPQLYAADISVKNGSPGSKVTCIPNISRDEVLAWLKE